MALFDPTDTIDVPHPGGGTITLPASVAQTLGLTPVGSDDAFRPGGQKPGQMLADDPNAPGIIHGGVPAAAGGEGGIIHGGAPLSVNAVESPIPIVARDIAAPQKPPPPPPQKISTGAAAIGNIPRGAALPPPVNAPTSVPPADQAVSDAATPPETTDTLRKGTTADELNQRTKALQQGAAAGQQAATNDAAYQTGMAHAYEARNQELDRIYADQKKAADANLAAINAKQASIDAAIDAYGKTPLDRTSDHPILNFLGILMASAGQGINHVNGQNPAMAALDKALDSKVNLQLEQMKIGQQRVGLMRDSLAQLQQNFTNQNAQFDALKAAAIQKAINTGDVMAAQLKSQQAITNWQTQRAALADQVAQLKGQAVDKQHAEDQAVVAAREAARKERVAEAQKEEELANVRRGQDVTMRGQNLDYAAKMAENDQKAADRAQAQQDSGVTAPDGSDFVRKNGTQYTAPKGREAEVQTASTAYNQYVHALDNLRTMRDAGGGHIVNNAAARQQIQELARAVSALQKTQGVTRISETALDHAQKEITGGADVNSVMRSVLPDLNQAREDAIDDYRTFMQGARFDNPDQIKFPDPLENGPAAESRQQRLATRIIDYNPAAPTDEEKQSLGIAGVAPDVSAMNPAKTARQNLTQGLADTATVFAPGPAAAIQSLESRRAGIPREYQQAIDMWGSVVADPKADPEKKKAAAAYLNQVATSPTASSDIKAYATRVMSSALGSSIPAD